MPALPTVAASGNTALPAASTPCSWKTRLAMSKPIVVISMVDGSLSSLHLTARAWHIDAVRGRPPHQIWITSLEDYMQRRDFIALLAGVFSWPSAAHAQQKAMAVIGLLAIGSPPRPPSSLMPAFGQGLSETGYVEGQNVAIEYRFAEGHYDRLPALAADLVGRQVDLIFAPGALPSALAAKNATSTIPIVFTSGDDPVAEGLVASLARPGGNLTGFSVLFTELTPKRIELLSELVPQVDVFAVLVNQNNAA